MCRKRYVLVYLCGFVEERIGLGVLACAWVAL